VDKSHDVHRGGPPVDELLDGLHDGRPLPCIDRPSAADEQCPGRDGLQLLDEVRRAGQADVQRGEDREPALPGHEAAANRQRRFSVPVELQAIVAVHIVPVAPVALAIVRDEDVRFDEGPDAFVDEQPLSAQQNVDMIDPVDAEPVAFDPRDGVAQRCLGRAEDTSRVVERIDDVQAEAQRHGRRQTAQIRRADRAELRAGGPAVEPHGARSVDEPEFGEAAHADHVAERGDILHGEGRIAQHLEERRLVCRVAIGVARRRGIALERAGTDLRDRRAEGQRSAEVRKGVARQLRTAHLRVRARERGRA
jgi:hypothetical protein